MILNKKIVSFFISLFVGFSSAIVITTTSCSSNDPIAKYVYGSTFEINADNANKVKEHAKTFLNKQAVRQEIKQSEFNTWKSEHTLTNNDFYWEMIIYYANTISSSKSGKFAINKWDVSQNKPTGASLAGINIFINNQSLENLSGSLSYNYNATTNRITCDSSNIFDAFDSWQWEAVTVVK